MAETDSFIYGKRMGNKSIKVYKQLDGLFVVIIKHYFAGFCYKKKRIIYSNYGEVEDCILDFKDQPSIR